MKKLFVEKQIYDNELINLEGQILDDGDYEIITDSTFIYEGDKIVALYFKNILEDEKSKLFHDNVIDYAKTKKTNNRHNCACGKKQTYITSSILGYYDISVIVDKQRYNHPHYFARMTNFNEKYPEKFELCLPLIKQIDTLYKTYAEEEYTNQYNKATDTPYYIKDTSFSTITLNYNYPTGLHKDKGNFKEGLTALTTFNNCKYAGGELIFPNFNLGFDLQTNDLLLMNSNYYHGNTQLIPLEEDYERLSSVFYLRDKMDVAYDNLLEFQGKQSPPYLYES